jgi:hypothetical protein
MKISAEVKKLLIITGSVLAVLLLGALVFVFWFSNPARFPTTASLWTDRAEFAAYAELFNASQDKYRIEIVFRRDAARAIERLETKGSTAGGAPDLVASPFLNNSLTISRFSPLHALFADEKRDTDKHSGYGLLEASQFYAEFLDLGRNREKIQLLLPVSFDLPALAFKQKSRQENDQLFSLNLESIKEESAAFNALEGDQFLRMGFSPRWNPQVLYLKTALFNTDFREEPLTAQIAWNEESLKQAVDFIREWIESVNQGHLMEQQFIDRYLYDPPGKLLSDGRILFTYTSLKDFFYLPPEIRSTFDFRWMASDDIIPVLDDALYIGIPAAADAKPAAQAFLLWFFSLDTQAELISSTQFKRMRTFGIAEGFSSLPAVNENLIPQYYHLKVTSLFLLLFLPDGTQSGRTSLFPGSLKRPRQQPRRKFRAFRRG